MPPKPRSATLIPALLIAFIAAMALLSPGFFEPYDENLHFLYAQKAFSDPGALLCLWARLGCTALFAITAPLGLGPTRLLAAAVTTLTAIGTTKLAGHFLASLPPTDSPHAAFLRRHHVAFICLLLFAQPCFAINSFTTMTEMPLACAWIWAAVTLTRNRPASPVFAGIFMGLAGLLRPEAWIAIACWPIFLTLWTRLHPAPHRLLTILLSTFLAGLPALAWFLAGALYYHDPRWILAYWPWAPASPYGKTGLMFIGASLLALAGWMWLPTLFALRQILRRYTSTLRAQALLLLILPFAGFFLMHGLLGTLGLFGSMSLPRYFIAIAPMIAILTFLGLIHAKPHPLLKPIAIAFPLGTLLFLIAMGHLPAWKTLATRRLDLAIHSIPADQKNNVIAAHPYILYAMNLPLDSRQDLRTLSAKDLENAPPGTLLLLENYIWQAEGRPTPEQLEKWNWQRNEKVQSATDALTDPLTSLRAPCEIAAVQLWTKQSASPAASPAAPSPLHPSVRESHDNLLGHPNE